MYFKIIYYYLFVYYLCIYYLPALNSITWIKHLALSKHSWNMGATKQWSHQICFLFLYTHFPAFLMAGQVMCLSSGQWDTEGGIVLLSGQNHKISYQIFYSPSSSGISQSDGKDAGGAECLNGGRRLGNGFSVPLYSYY